MGNEPIPIGCTALKPVERHGWDAVAWFLYDKETGAIMGRTPKSWILITIFYIIYYSCLAAFWAVMLIIFFQFVDNKQPMWQLDYSRIGRSPALGVRPDQTNAHVDSSMIIFNKDLKEDIKYKIPGYEGWVNRTSKFLEDYKIDVNDNNGHDCSTKEGFDAVYQDYTGRKFCTFEIADLKECSGSDDPHYGYKTGNPCVILKLNRIFGLEHDYVESMESAWAKKNKDHMPQELQERITKANNKKQVWVSCIGQNSADREAIKKITYFPSDGAFPGFYYPYMNQDNYKSPLIAVKLEIPETYHGQFIHVECRAWAENIKYDKRDRMGSAHFEVMVHSGATAAKVDNNM